MTPATPEAAAEIRIVREDEQAAAVSSIVGAFLTDPVARFAWPSVHDYLRAMPVLTRAFGGESFGQKAALASGDLAGVALWLPPGAHPDGDAMEKHVRETAVPSRLDDLLATLERMEESHPEEPHWYLPMIGVEPHAQGRGLGGALMHHAADRCDADGVLAYLESSNPRNISLYERHGFEIMGRIQVGAAPLVTPMLRRPR